MTQLTMVKLEAGTIQWLGPENLPDETEKAIEHAVTTFGFLLNTSERRGRWFFFTEFADMIEKNFETSAKIDYVLHTLRFAGA